MQVLYFLIITPLPRKVSSKKGSFKKQLQVNGREPLRWWTGQHNGVKTKLASTEDWLRLDSILKGGDCDIFFHPQRSILFLPRLGAKVWNKAYRVHLSEVTSSKTQNASVAKQGLELVCLHSRAHALSHTAILPSPVEGRRTRKRSGKGFWETSSRSKNLSPSRSDGNLDTDVTWRGKSQARMFLTCAHCLWCTSETSAPLPITTVPKTCLLA